MGVPGVPLRPSSLCFSIFLQFFCGERGKYLLSSETVSQRLYRPFGRVYFVALQVMVSWRRKAFRRLFFFNTFELLLEKSYYFLSFL
jgi:hypothetical protein